MKKLTKEDVWGKFTEDWKLVDRGMIVAQGFPSSMSKEDLEGVKDKLKLEYICPVWKDRLPYKSVTVICDEAQVNEVKYWLSYVHGGNNVIKEKSLADGKYAIRSNYTCW